MPYQAKFSRSEQQTFSLEARIASDNMVRFIEAFVEKLELDKLGFVKEEVKIEGRPMFEQKTFLKLYLYGYLNGIRSSRKLERESRLNIELHWLLCNQQPNYHSIADFRKDNAQALQQLFKLFVEFLKEGELIGGEVVAIDGTKIRANNSKKNNYNGKKIERQLEYIEKKTVEYLNELQANDKEDSELAHIQSKIERLKVSKAKYENLGEQLQAGDEPQISTTDTDSRALLVHGQVVEVAYNVQTSVDSKHKLVVGTHTINRNDRNALSKAALEAKANLGVENLTIIADKGYHNGKELQITQSANITTIVAIAELVNSNAHGTQTQYLVNKFSYNPADDTYTCPEGQTLHSTGKWHPKKRERNVSYEFKKYRTSACLTCAVRDKCTGRQDGRREIERSEYAEAVEKNAENYQKNPQLYRQRQEINEHIYGTIKRHLGYYYTNLRGLEKINGEMALVMTVYNLKRSWNILGMSQLMEKLQTWQPDYEKVIRFMKKWLYLKRFKPLKTFQMKMAV